MTIQIKKYEVAYIKSRLNVAKGIQILAEQEFNEKISFEAALLFTIHERIGEIAKRTYWTKLQMRSNNHENKYQC